MRRLRGADVLLTSGLAFTGSPWTGRRKRQVARGVIRHCAPWAVWPASDLAAHAAHRLRQPVAGVDDQACERAWPLPASRQAHGGGVGIGWEWRGIFSRIMQCPVAPVDPAGQGLPASDLKLARYRPIRGVQRSPFVPHRVRGSLSNCSFRQGSEAMHARPSSR